MDNKQFVEAAMSAFNEAKLLPGAAMSPKDEMRWIISRFRPGFVFKKIVIVYGKFEEEKGRFKIEIPGIGTAVPLTVVDWEISDLKPYLLCAIPPKKEGDLWRVIPFGALSPLSITALKKAGAQGIFSLSDKEWTGRRFEHDQKKHADDRGKKRGQKPIVVRFQGGKGFYFGKRVSPNAGCTPTDGLNLVRVIREHETRIDVRVTMFHGSDATELLKEAEKDAEMAVAIYDEPFDVTSVDCWVALGLNGKTATLPQILEKKRELGAVKFVSIPAEAAVEDSVYKAMVEKEFEGDVADEETMRVRTLVLAESVRKAIEIVKHRASQGPTVPVVESSAIAPAAADPSAASS